jgi:hypothetical protein
MQYFFNKIFMESIVRINDDGSISGIPIDEANIDYQAYLAWVAEGNTAEEWQPEQETN